MLGEYDFRLSQIQYIKAAMDQIATYQPLAMTPAQMQTEYDNGVAVRSDFQTKFSAEKLARGLVNQIVVEGHELAVGVYGVMKTRYRKNPAALEAILKLPVQDQSFEQTRVRLELMASLWAQLPDDPHASPPGPMVAWPGMTLITFGLKLTALKNARSAFITATEDFEMAEADLHAKEAHLADLAGAALAEGRSQFAQRTPEREVIDSIPTALSTHEPNQAVITVATSPGSGEAHLEFDALHATSFDVLHKAPGETEFSLIADDIIEKLHNASGLAPGNHEFKVIGQNSRGNGPESEVAIITVA